MSGAVGSTFSGSAGLIFFILYVYFGPGMIVFQLVALVRYYWLNITNNDPKAIIQWSTDPDEIKSYLRIGVIITIIPIIIGLIFK